MIKLPFGMRRPRSRSPGPIAPWRWLLAVACVVAVSGLGRDASANPLLPIGDKLIKACGRKISIQIYGDDWKMNPTPDREKVTDQDIIGRFEQRAEDLIRLCKQDPALASRVSTIENRSSRALPRGVRSDERIETADRFRNLIGWRYVAGARRTSLRRVTSV